MTTGSYGAPVRQAFEFFDRTLSVFKEEDSGYAPTPTQFSVAQQVAHVGQTIDWFMAGGFRPSGFDLDFAAHNAQIREVTSLAAARSWLERAIEDAVKTLNEMTPEKMMEPLPEGPILGGEPRAAVVGAICEHTAHHRGSLAVYARLLGRKPPVPYGD
jgi:uncharacterized damage-inducible protein DinB